MTPVITATIQHRPGANKPVTGIKAMERNCQDCHYFLDIMIVFLEKTREKHY